MRLHRHAVFSCNVVVLRVNADVIPAVMQQISAANCDKTPISAFQRIERITLQGTGAAEARFRPQKRRIVIRMRISRNIAGNPARPQFKTGIRKQVFQNLRPVGDNCNVDVGGTAALQFCNTDAFGVRYSGRYDLNCRRRSFHFHFCRRNRFVFIIAKHDPDFHFASGRYRMPGDLEKAVDAVHSRQSTTGQAGCKCGQEYSAVLHEPSLQSPADPLVIR